MNGTGESDKTVAVLSLFIIMIHEKSIIVELEGQGTLDGGNVQVFRNVEKERLKIIEMRQCDAEKMGICRSALKYIKDRIRKGKRLISKHWQ